MNSRFGKEVEMNEEEILLEDGPLVDFHGATLQIQQDLYQSRSPSSLGDDNESASKLVLSPEGVSGSSNIQSGTSQVPPHETLKRMIPSGSDVISPITSIPKKISETLKRSKSRSDDNSNPNPNTSVVCQNPIIPQDDAKDFFSYRDGLVENAIKECINNILTTDTDGELLGNWLLTEISIWDNEKERLILLTDNSLITIKYDFIALKQLEFRKISLHNVDTLVIGDLIYPPGSLVPRLNGLATGVVTVVKGCLLRPLQERWTRVPPGNQDFCASSPFDHTCFEPRSRNVRGLRAMWNGGEPLTFSKKWNPFNNEIPWTTYTSHPLFFHKEGGSKSLYDVEEFARTMVLAVERCQTMNSNAAAPCRVEHKPILLQNYIGLSSFIHNRNSLGFFKVRGKFSF